MATRNFIAIDFSHRRLRAIEAVAHRGGIKILRSLSDEVPEGITQDDSPALGRWIGRRLRESGVSADNAIFSVNREHAVTRRLTLPTTNSDELPSMVGLSLKRDLPIDSDQAVIDFIEVQCQETTTDVLACAIPREVLGRVSDVAEAAGFTVAAISLRCFGTAKLLGSLPENQGRNALAIDLGAGGFEFVIANDESIGFARGVEVLPGSEESEEVLVTEIRRTWISHTLADGSNEQIESGVLLATSDVAHRLELDVSRALGLEVVALDAHPMVQLPADFDSDTWPLAGLLLTRFQGSAAINFAAPRKAPDLQARRRQRVLILLGLVLVAAFGGWTLGNKSLSSTLDSNAELAAKAKTALKEYHRNRRDGFRLEHLEAWAAIDPDWLSHVESIRSFIPDPSRVVLDDLSLALVTSGIDHEKRTGFSELGEVRMEIAGESIDRATIDGVRAQLVAEENIRLKSNGSEKTGGRRLQVPFDFQLRTDVETATESEGGS